MSRANVVSSQCISVRFDSALDLIQHELAIVGGEGRIARWLSGFYQSVVSSSEAGTAYYHRSGSLETLAPESEYNHNIKRHYPEFNKIKGVRFEYLRLTYLDAKALLHKAIVEPQWRRVFCELMENTRFKPESGQKEHYDTLRKNLCLYLAGVEGLAQLAKLLAAVKQSSVDPRGMINLLTGLQRHSLAAGFKKIMALTVCYKAYLVAPRVDGPLAHQLFSVAIPGHATHLMDALMVGGRLNFGETQGLPRGYNLLQFALACRLRSGALLKIVCKTVNSMHCNELGRTALMVAIRVVANEAVLLLLKRAAVVDALAQLDGGGLNALHHAIECNNLDAVKLLLAAAPAEQARLLVRIPTKAGVSPLWLACEQAKARMGEKGAVLDDAMVEALVRAGADIDRFQHGQSPSEFLGYDLAVYRAVPSVKVLPAEVSAVPLLAAGADGVFSVKHSAQRLAQAGSVVDAELVVEAVKVTSGATV